jgi:hypothetical protein
MGTKTEMSMVFNILAKKTADIWIAHCLELDIVATSASLESLKEEIKDLILTQVDYAFSNDNLENLYHPAPAEVWKEFYKCQNATEDRIKVKSAFQVKKKATNRSFVPPWIIAKTCFAQGVCSV